METLYEAFYQAAYLIITLDADLLEISVRSFILSFVATAVAAFLGIGFGTWLALYRFRFRRLIIAILNALMGLPPVAIGLIVYILLSQSGPFGVLGLLFSPTAMIIAQIIIITPIIASFTHQAVRNLWADYHDLLISLNASRNQRMVTLILDSRRSLLTAILAGFGRAIGEVGAVMIVGGNIDHYTRVLTTAISLETGKGDFALALAMGFVLISLTVLVNILVHFLSGTETSSRW